MTDTLPPGSFRLLCVTDHAGIVLLGKMPAEEPNLRERFIADWKAKGLVPEGYT